MNKSSSFAQEFDTPQEALAHYGVMGMKWGKHKTKVTTSEIKDARLRVAGENVKWAQQKKALKTNLKAKGATRAEKKVALSKLDTKFLAQPDRMTAMRLTKGEKAVLALLTVAPGGQSAALNVAIQRGVVRGKLERAQERKANSSR